ncbi:hypothetical protein Tco_0633684, partial [Tanacetum coccineum]
RQAGSKRKVSFKEKIFPFKAQSVTCPGSSGDFPSFHLPEEEVVVASQEAHTLEVSNEQVTTKTAIPTTMSAPEQYVPTSSKAAIPTRKSSSNSSKPAWLKDFVTPKTSSSSANATCSESLTKHPKYHIFTKNDFMNILGQHIPFLANVFASIKQSSYAQASKHPEWIQGMQAKLNALEKNKT